MMNLSEKECADYVGGSSVDVNNIGQIIQKECHDLLIQDNRIQIKKIIQATRLVYYALRKVLNEFNMTKLSARQISTKLTHKKINCVINGASILKQF